MRVLALTSPWTCRINFRQTVLEGGCKEDFTTQSATVQIKVLKICLLRHGMPTLLAYVQVVGFLRLTAKPTVCREQGSAGESLG